MAVSYDMWNFEVKEASLGDEFFDKYFGQQSFKAFKFRDRRESGTKTLADELLNQNQKIQLVEHDISELNSVHENYLRWADTTVSHPAYDEAILCYKAELTDLQDEMPDEFEEWRGSE